MPQRGGRGRGGGGNEITLFIICESAAVAERERYRSAAVILPVGVYRRRCGEGVGGRPSTSRVERTAKKTGHCDRSLCTRIINHSAALRHWQIAHSRAAAHTHARARARTLHTIFAHTDRPCVCVFVYIMRLSRRIYFLNNYY